ESDKNRLWQAASGVLSPQNTIIAPVGINYDAAGIIRSVFLGLKLSEIARDGEYTAESGFVKAALADYKALSLALGQEAREFNLRGEDLVNMARGKTMEIIVTSLNRLIKLLLIMPVNIEEQREIYEHAREVLARA
ncbi:MAG: hypothetical protein KJ995_05980, partial [Candidatus Omnitrophica bacterium]|nr:hypothetical protein [Candidatus Omnitrophota bacterium]MBU1127637.1 hypothetical protein [Candidatus Omnitrophota bacterium]MBU1851936.1 hypothetical protein [Candidatus Omnitrophota bacterium]